MRSVIKWKSSCVSLLPGLRHGLMLLEIGLEFLAHRMQVHGLPPDRRVRVFLQWEWQFIKRLAFRDALS